MSSYLIILNGLNILGNNGFYSGKGDGCPKVQCLEWVVTNQIINICPRFWTCLKKLKGL